MLASCRERALTLCLRLQSQITTIQMEVSGTQSSTEKSLQLRISELLAMLEKQQTTITTQEEVRKSLINNHQ